MMADWPGIFVTFEGPEGGGKSTQAERLANRLESEGRTVVRTREPGGTPVGEAIRCLLQHDEVGHDLVPEAELLLFEASRAQLVREIILPALLRGDAVISDRFADSTTAYQGYGRGEPIEPLLAINDYAIATAVPNVTFLIDIDTDTGFRRLAERYSGGPADHDRFERETREFHEKVRQGYLALSKRWPNRFQIIDGAQDVDSVSDGIWNIFETLSAARSS